MSRIRKNPLRPLTDQERQLLEQLVHARSERADVVTWARELLAVASGQSYVQAAAMDGRRSDEAVSQLVARFNRDGLAALEPHGKGGPKPTYDAVARERILAEARRTPDPQRDGTATWSLVTLRNALRRASDGLPHVSTYTIGQVLHAAGLRWVAARTWCDTGKAVRRRRSGTLMTDIVKEMSAEGTTDFDYALSKFVTDERQVIGWQSQFNAFPPIEQASIGHAAMKLRAINMFGK